MKVIVLCSNLESGGAQRAAFRLSGEFRKMGIESENWFLHKKSDVFLDEPGVKLILPGKIKRVFDYPIIFYRLYIELRKNKPDAVISFLHYSNVIGQTIAWLSNVKYRVASHRNTSERDMSKLFRFLDKICAEIGIYTSVTAVSESTKRSFNYYSRKKYREIKVIPNGLSFVPSKLTVNEARAQFNIPFGVQVIGNIGRLSAQKNQKLLIDVLTRLKHVHLVIVGDGDLRIQLLKQAELLGVSSRLHLLGEVSFRKIPDFFKAIDLFVMPSFFEGLSNALIEALNAGLPIIASDIDSQSDVIVSPSGQQAGFLLPVDDVNAWTKTIGELLDDSDERTRLKIKAEDRGKFFSLNNMVNGFLSTITDEKTSRPVEGLKVD